MACIAKGHGTLSAIKQNNWTEAPVVYQDFESEEQLYAFVQSDNAIAAWSDLDLPSIHTDLPDLAPFDIELLGIKDFQFEPDPHDGDEDAVPETPKIAKTKRGELWILGDHKLLIDDCTVKENVDRLMGGEKADMCFTSPPYSDLRDYGGGIDLAPQTLSKFFDWPTKTFYVNLGLIVRDREIVCYWDEYLNAARSRSLKLLSWNVWDKGNASAPAHQQAMFGLCHEWIFAFGEYRELNLTNKNEGMEVLGRRTRREKDGSISEQQNSRTATRTHRQLDTVIAMQRQHNFAADYDGSHPAPFPSKLAEEYIAASSNNGDLVADPFLGSGSTLIACEKTNRKCYGMEIETLYGDVILSRFAKFSGKDPVREDGVKWSSLV